MKCKQIFIERHDGKYCLVLDTWTADKNTRKEIPGTRSSEPVAPVFLLKGAAEVKASILDKKWSCTYPHTDRL